MVKRGQGAAAWQICRIVLPDMYEKPCEGEELERISCQTLAHYEQRAEDFRAGTAGHDVSQNIDALLRHISGKPPFTILDLSLIHI